MSLLLIFIIICLIFIIIAIYNDKNKENKDNKSPDIEKPQPIPEPILSEVDSSMLAIEGSGNGQGVSAPVHWSGPDYKAGDVRETPLPYLFPQTQWMNNQGYTACYPEVASEDNNCDYFQYMDYDEKNTRQTQMRQQRDKKAQEGWASKNSYYYRKHYASELDDYEKKPWWGNDEV